MKLGQKEGRKLAVELAKKYPREVLEEVGAILCCNPLGGTKVKASQLIAAGQKMGIKKVAEWLKDHNCGFESCDMEYGMLDKQLKKWGIKKDD